MLIMNNCGSLTSKWYRKVTDTGLTLNYHSLAPVKYKKSVVSSFVYRIFKSCSTWQLFHAGIKEAMTILSNNQYPESFVYPIVNSTIRKLVTCNNDNLDTSSDVDDTITTSLLEEIKSKTIERPRTRRRKKHKVKLFPIMQRSEES